MGKVTRSGIGDRREPLIGEDRVGEAAVGWIGLAANQSPVLEPLSATEETFWRALMRVVLVLPRHLHNDTVRATGRSSSEYTVIMNLSEAPNRQLRMASGMTAYQRTGLAWFPA